MASLAQPTLFPPKNVQRGFTLIELMVTLGIFAMLLAVGMPYMQTFVSRSSAAAESKRLRTDIQYAREESATFNLPVVVCASSNGTSCVGDTQWEAGWIVFWDRDASGTPSLTAAACADGDDCIRRVSQPITQDFTMIGNESRLSFDATGAMAAGGATSFSICGPEAQATGDVAHSYTVSISAAGINNLRKGTASCP